MILCPDEDSINNVKGVTFSSIRTISLLRKRSKPVITNKKRQSNVPCLFRSGKRDSNSRPSAWEADALPTELFPQSWCKYRQNFKPFSYCTVGFSIL